MPQLRVMFEAPGAQEPFPGLLQSQAGWEAGLGYLRWARSRRRSPMVSVSSILSSYVCSPLSDRTRSLQSSGAAACSAALTLGSQSPVSPGRAPLSRNSLPGPTRAQQFGVGNVLEVNEALSDPPRPAQCPNWC